MYFLKGRYKIFVNKGKVQLAKIITFNEKFLSDWCLADNFFMLPVAIPVFRLNTTKTCGSNSNCIFTIIDEMKNLIALASSRSLNT